MGHTAVGPLLRAIIPHDVFQSRKKTPFVFVIFWSKYKCGNCWQVDKTVLDTGVGPMVRNWRAKGLNITFLAEWFLL